MRGCFPNEEKIEVIIAKREKGGGGAGKRRRRKKRRRYALVLMHLYWPLEKTLGEAID